MLSYRQCHTILQHFSQLQCTCQHYSQGVKTHRALKIIKMRKENKSLFGELIETNRERKKKLNTCTVDESANGLNVDTELFWMKNVSGMKMQKIKFRRRLGTDSNTTNNAVNNVIDETKNSSVTEDEEVILTNTESLTRTMPTEGLNETVSGTRSNLEEESSLKRSEGTNATPNNTFITEETTVLNNTVMEMPVRLPKAEVTDIICSDTNNDKLYSDVIEPPKLRNIIIKNIVSFPIFSDKSDFNEDPSESDTILRRRSINDILYKKYPSVTRILDATMPPERRLILERWKRKKIDELGTEGFELYMKDVQDNGKLLHSCIERSVLGEDVETPAQIESAFESLRPVLNDIRGVKAIESHVTHTKLMYRGIMDCVAYYRDKLCLIDWKKSDKMKRSLDHAYDAPLQVASYIGAVNSSRDYPFQVQKGIVVFAYTNGSQADVHEMSLNTLQKYWRLWLLRLQQYHSEVTLEKQQ